MNRRFKLFFLFVLILASAAKAQTSFIKGRLISGRNVVDYASVILQGRDSSFVTGVVSDKNARFRMDGVKDGDYLLAVSCIGYSDKKMKIKVSGHSLDLGDIQMDSLAHQLKEVVVTGGRVIRTQDKQVAMPTKFQLESSTNGLELLKAMQLSRLHIDPVKNTISSSAQGEVQTRINGVKVDIHQIQALRPDEIQRVDYYDNPGMQYGQGVACVIDYITRRPISGGELSFDAKNSPFDAWGQDEISGSYNKGKSQFGAYLWGMYRNLDQWRDNKETFNFSDGKSFTRMEDGKPDKFKVNYVFANFYYNYKMGDKWYLNMTMNTTNSSQNVNTRSQLFPIEDRKDYVNMMDINKTTNDRPWLDLYFQRNYSKRRTLIVDVVGTYIHNTVGRDYSEDKGTDVLTSLNSDVRGNKYSLIGEAIYTTGVTKNSSLSFGLRCSQAYTTNDYKGTVNTSTNMHDGYGQGFVEWKQTLGKFNYSCGSYLSYIWMLQNADKLYQTEWYPKLSMSYTISDNSYIRFSGERSYTTPSLSDLSNVTQVIDSLQIRRGNPDLKVSHTWMTNMYYEWRKDKFTLGLNLYYQYQQNPVMEETLIEGDKFIRTNRNQKSWQQLTPEVQLQVGPLFNLISFNLTGGVNYFDSHGIDYHHYYTNWYYTAEATLQYKKFTLMLQTQNHRNFFYGETSTSGESLLLAMARYRIKRVVIGMMIINPLSNRDSYNVPTINHSCYAPSHQSMHVRQAAQLMAITFNWNFSFGRKYEGGQKQLSNEDKDSGTMKSGK